jgi:hypothetical protein
VTSRSIPDRADATARGIRGTVSDEFARQLRRPCRGYPRGWEFRRLTPPAKLGWPSGPQVTPKLGWPSGPQVTPKLGWPSGPQVTPKLGWPSGPQVTPKLGWPSGP